MPRTTRSPQSRPHGAPAYYLARPASLWITALRPPHQHRISQAASAADHVRKEEEQWAT